MKAISKRIKYPPGQNIIRIDVIDGDEECPGLYFERISGRSGSYYRLLGSSKRFKTMDCAKKYSINDYISGIKHNGLIDIWQLKEKKEFDFLFS